MPDKHRPECEAIIAQLTTLGDSVNQSRTNFVEMTGRLSAVLTSVLANQKQLTENLGPEVSRLRSELMGRMDRLQDDLSKQQLEMQAAVELLRDSSPPALLSRIRQPEGGIREFKVKGEG